MLRAAVFLDFSLNSSSNAVFFSDALWGNQALLIKFPRCVDVGSLLTSLRWRNSCLAFERSIPSFGLWFSMADLAHYMSPFPNSLVFRGIFSFPPVVASVHELLLRCTHKSMLVNRNVYPFWICFRRDASWHVIIHGRIRCRGCT